VKLGFRKIVQCTAIQPVQLERKVGIDVGDVYFAQATAILCLLSRARLGLDSMLNETRGNIRTNFGNARERVSPFKYAIRRCAGAEQKCIENIE
jgi:hypothetical protein